MTLRVAVGDPRTVSMTFPAVATGAVVVTVDSERLDTSAGPFTATQVGVTPTYEYPLTAAQCSVVDDLKVTFVATVAAIERRQVEHVQVSGGYYFTAAEARLVGPIDGSFTDAVIESSRFAVEDQIEANCNTSFVARFVKERINGRESDEFVRLSEPYIVDLVSVTEDSVDITDDVQLDGRYLWRTTGCWASGHRNIVVRYEQGFDEYPPEDLRRKAIEATRFGLLREKRTGLPQQAISLTTDQGAMRLAVAGLRQPFGLPEVDAVVLSWAKRVGADL
jgi:hypothetical protein